MSANTRETYAAVSIKKQSALGTPNPQADFLRFTKTNAALATTTIVNEDDGQDMGKGDEFPQTLYPSHLDFAVPIEAFMTSELVAWAAAFGLGNVVKSGTTPNFIYTITPSVPLTAGIDLPTFTYAEAIRPGAAPVLHDLKAPGCVVNDFQIQLQSGPGRESSKISVGIVGTGRYTEPSALDFGVMSLMSTPLPAYGASITIQGVDYTTSGRIISLNFGWNNNVRLDSGFFPGSGKQMNHQIRGRMEHGDRAGSLDFVARIAAGNAERAALSALTTGTAAITIPYNASNEVTITCHKVAFREVTLGDTDGIVHIAGTMSVMKHSTNGVVTIVAKCNVDDIGALTA